eukprot:GGOE01054454.1.p1 GENE.GGOE01054454.1~~GGOE01054454.1.p1  ORF type:complete len:217 (+),score=16.03 GGOE01054454.1:24-674(+)
MTVCGSGWAMKPIPSETSQPAKRKPLQREMKPRLLSGTRPPVVGRKHIVWYVSGRVSELEFCLPDSEEAVQSGCKGFTKEPPSSVRSVTPDSASERRPCVDEAPPRPPSSSCSSSSRILDSDDLVLDIPPSTPPERKDKRLAASLRSWKVSAGNRLDAKAAAGLVALRQPFRLQFPTVPIGPQLPPLWYLHVRCEQARAMQHTPHSQSPPQTTLPV